MEVSSTIFKVFGMTWPRIEHRSRRPLATLYPLGQWAEAPINTIMTITNTFIFIIIAKSPQNLSSFMLPAHNYNTPQKSDVLMISTLIIITTQENSPQNRHFILKKNPWKPKKFYLQKSISHPTHPLFPSYTPLPSPNSSLSTNSRNMGIYVKMHASTYAGVSIYVRRSNSTYTSILTFNDTQT